MSAGNLSHVTPELTCRAGCIAKIGDVVRGQVERLVLGRELRANVSNIIIERRIGSGLRLALTRAFYIGCGPIVKKRLEGQGVFPITECNG